MREPHDPTEPGELVRYGTVATVGLAGGTVTVRAGDVVSSAVPWLERRAGTTRSWSPPSVGEQGLLICPDGELGAAVFMPGIFSDAAPPPATTDVDVRLFEDGTLLRYDPRDHRLEASLCGGGTAIIVADGGITLDGPVRVTGNLTCDATVTGSTDVIGGGKSLKTHVHPGVQSGSASTGAPA